MLILIFLAALAAGLAGLVVKYLLDRNESYLEITWKEFAIGMAVIAVVIAPITNKVGWAIAKSNKLSFNEYRNGWELRADWTKTECTRDGSCRHTYSCDPYEVFHTHTRSVSDGDGGTTTEIYTETHTEYHSCPYVTEEWHFGIDTTLGNYVIDQNRFPTNPASHAWRGGVGVPNNVPSGIPPFWQSAYDRIQAGKPGPVTKRMQYDNYILASDQTILKDYSGKIAEYKKAKLLPKVVNTVHSFYLADKVSFVGYTPTNNSEWQETLRYFDASLGDELHGDLHVVITQNASINGNPDAYIIALKAYWSDPKVFKDDAISKNSIIVVVGTEDGKKISWARATTGMPLGNEDLSTAVRNLKDTELTPQALIGSVNGEFYEKVSDGKTKLKVKGLHGQGALEKIVWGLENPDTKFVRVSMQGGDKDDVGTGFKYLGDEIQPSGIQKFWMLFMTFILSMIVWWFAAAAGVRLSGNGRRRSNAGW